MSSFLVFYAFLTISTLVVFLLGLNMCVRARSVGPAIGTFILYYWSILGAWMFVADQVRGYSDLEYEYLFIKMFPVNLDKTYYLSLWYYVLFILSVQIGFLAWMKKAAQASVGGIKSPVFFLNHRKLIACFVLSLASSYWIIHREVSYVFESNLILHDYLETSENLAPFLALHKLLNIFARLSIGTGIVILASGAEPKLISGAYGKRLVPLYVIGIFVAFSYFAMLGNKNELLIVLIAMLLFYISNHQRPRYGIVCAVGFFSLSAIISINTIRALPANSWSVSVIESSFFTSLKAMISNNELFGAHFSMYGVLAKDIPLTYGLSFISLVCSVVPLFVWPLRPQGIYEYYVESVGAMKGQGYSIHHATGWYCNFGVIGIIFGGLLLGVIWAHMTTRIRLLRHRQVWRQSLAKMGPCMFVATFPSLIRSGPEAFKSLVIMVILLPFFLLWTCQVRGRSSSD